MKAKQSEVTYIRKEWISVEDRLPEPSYDWEGLSFLLVH